MSTERALRHRNGYISRETSLGMHQYTAVLEQRIALQTSFKRNAAKLDCPNLIYSLLQKWSSRFISFDCICSISDGSQHKIMNFKLEDFDMVKTIGTG